MTSTQIDVKDYSYFADNQWRRAEIISSSRFTSLTAESSLPVSRQVLARMRASRGCRIKASRMGGNHPGGESSPVLEGCGDRQASSKRDR